MPCQDCPQEGRPNLPPQLVVGWKVWLRDGSVRGGRTPADWAALPDDGILCVLLYYNRFSTDGQTRYRRVIQDDYYWMAPGTLDHIYGQHSEKGHDLADLHRRYPGVVVKRGAWTDDAHFKVLIDEALNDHQVSLIGLRPEPGTDDR